MLVKSTRLLLMSLVFGLFFGLGLPGRAKSADPYFKERFPDPIIAHLHVASPMKFLSDLDDSTTAATRGVRQASYPSGTIKMFASLLSPLPLGAWNENEDAHALFAVIDERPRWAVIVNADSIEDFEDTMDGSYDEDEFGNKLFIGKAKSSRDKFIITDLGKGKFFVTGDIDAYEALRPCLDDWFPSSPARSGCLLRIDFQSMARYCDEFVNAALTMIKHKYFDQPDLWEKLDEKKEEESDPDKLAELDKFEAFLIGWKNIGSILEQTVYAIFTMIDMIGMELDFAGDQLELSFAVSGVKNSILEEKVNLAQALGPLPFLFADKVPDDAQAYMAGTDRVNFNKELIAFSRRILYELFEEAAPEIPELFDTLANDYLHAGLREFASFSHILPDGEDVESLYSTWDNPDEVLPLLEKSCASLVRLQEVILGFLHPEDFAVHTDMDDEDEDDIAWLDNIQSDGFLAPLRPVVRYDEYEPTGDRYLHITLRSDFEQFIPPSRREDDTFDALYNMEYELQDFQIVAMQKDDLIHCTGGLLFEVSPTDVLDHIFSVWNGDTPNFIENTALMNHNKPRQNSVAVLFLLDMIVSEAISWLPSVLEEELEEEQIEKLVDKLVSLDNENASLYVYDGAKEGALVQSLVLPAKTVNIGLKNYFRMERELKNSRK